MNNSCNICNISQYNIRINKRIKVQITFEEKEQSKIPMKRAMFPVSAVEFNNFNNARIEENDFAAILELFIIKK